MCEINWIYIHIDSLRGWPWKVYIGPWSLDRSHLYCITHERFAHLAFSFLDYGYAYDLCYGIDCVLVHLLKTSGDAINYASHKLFVSSQAKSNRFIDRALVDYDRHVIDKVIDGESSTFVTGDLLGVALHFHGGNTLPCPQEPRNVKSKRNRRQKEEGDGGVPDDFPEHICYGFNYGRCTGSCSKQHICRICKLKHKAVGCPDRKSDKKDWLCIDGLTNKASGPLTIIIGPLSSTRGVLVQEYSGSTTSSIVGDHLTWGYFRLESGSLREHHRSASGVWDHLFNQELSLLPRKLFDISQGFNSAPYIDLARPDSYPSPLNMNAVEELPINALDDIELDPNIPYKYHQCHCISFAALYCITAESSSILHNIEQRHYLPLECALVGDQK